jgi:cysteine desulfurase
MAALAAAHGVPMHSDAVQAAGHLRLDFGASGLDAMSVTAHKLGGPIGIGALVLKRELLPAPLLHGGGQERQLRSGTVPVALIAGFAAAVAVAVRRRADSVRRIEGLRRRLIEGIAQIAPDAVVNGRAISTERLPNIAHVTFPRCEGDALLMLLDAQGVSVSTGPACTAGVQQASHVLLATGASRDAALGSLRFSLGHSSTEAEIDHLLAVLPLVLDKARVARAVRSEW